MQSGEIFDILSAFFKISTITTLLSKAELLPRRIIAFPDFSAKPQASTVTFGLDSYIIAIKPSGTVTLVMKSPS